LNNRTTVKKSFCLFLMRKSEQEKAEFEVIHQVERAVKKRTKNGTREHGLPPTSTPLTHKRDKEFQAGDRFSVSSFCCLDLSSAS